MREVSVLCFVALLASVVEARPSAFESVTGVIFTENTDLIPSLEYAEVATSSGYPDVAISTEYSEGVTFIHNSELTSVDYSEEPISTEYAREATSTQYAEEITSTWYAEEATSTQYAEEATSTQYAEEATSTPYAEEATSTQYAEEATSTQYAEEASSTTYAEEATSTQYAEDVSSTPNAEKVTPTQYAEMTTEDKIDVKTTKDFVVENATSEITTEDINVTGSTDRVEDSNEIVKSSTETTAEFSKETSTERIINLREIFTRNTEAKDAGTVREVGVDSSTEFNRVRSTLRGADHLRFAKNVEETYMAKYAAVEVTTGSANVPGSFGDFEGSPTEVPVAVNKTVDVVEDAEEEDNIIGLVRLKKHDPEPIVNSSMILPCFEVHARRGITPFIARSHDFEAELESWIKRKLPTEIAFLNNDNSIHFVDLTERPPSTNDLQVKEYGDTVSLYLFTRHGAGTGVKLSLDVRQTLRAGFNPNHPTKVVTHGFWSNTNSSSVQQLKDAYLRFGYYNVIIVDWSPLVYGFYSSAREETHGVGDYLGQFLRFLVYEGLTEPQRLHLIGHSLGAHVVGFAGKRAHLDGWGIKRITGLDPAMPYFTMANHTGRLDSTDADIVDVIHTCANFLGMTSFLGDIDFYPNEGTNYQPGCNLDVFGICSHGRAVDYFAESISEPAGFVGKFCDFERADSIVKAETCPGEPVAIMGEWLDFSLPGRYVLRTAASPPFGVGYDILYPAYLYKRARMLPSNITETVVA